MNQTEFESLLDRYGADLEIWAEADRAAARALIKASATARAALANQEQVEGRLAVLSHHVTPGLEGRIQALATPVDSDGWAALANWLRQSPWRSAGVAAAPLALGLVLGITLAPPDQREPGYTEAFEEIAWSDPSEYFFDE